MPIIWLRLAFDFDAFPIHVIRHLPVPLRLPYLYVLPIPGFILTTDSFPFTTLYIVTLRSPDFPTFCCYGWIP